MGDFLKEIPQTPLERYFYMKGKDEKNLCDGASLHAIFYPLRPGPDPARASPAGVLGWHQSYQVKGQDIIVDISPLIPDASQLPVLEVSPMPPIPDALFRQEVPHWKNPGDGRNEPGSLVISARGNP